MVPLRTAAKSTPAPWAEPEVTAAAQLQLVLARRLLNELHHIHAVEAVQGAAEAIRRRCHCHSSRFSPNSGVFSHYSTRNGEKQYIPRNFDRCSLPCPASFPIFLLYFVQTICYNNGCKCAGGSMDRASDSGSEGWGFESLLACHSRTPILIGLASGFCYIVELRKAV